jgi:hypothetical protein
MRIWTEKDLTEPSTHALLTCDHRVTKRNSGEDGAPRTSTICVAAPAYVGDNLAHQRDQVRWFGGMVGNHVADVVERYGPESNFVPPALSDFIKDRKSYDYSHHGKVR